MSQFSRKTIIFTGASGVQHFLRDVGVQIFQRSNLFQGSSCYFLWKSIEMVILQRGSGPPVPILDSRTLFTKLLKIMMVVCNDDLRCLKFLWKVG